MRKQPKSVILLSGILLAAIPLLAYDYYFRSIQGTGVITPEEGPNHCYDAFYGSGTTSINCLAQGITYVTSRHDYAGGMIGINCTMAVLDDVWADSGEGQYIGGGSYMSVPGTSQIPFIATDSCSGDYGCSYTNNGGDNPQYC